MTPADVGSLLRHWRERRRYSQLELANAAEVSTRHLSYIETGRSTPSAAMILRLAQQLDVPMRDRNALLLAGGYAPAYPETEMHAPEMAPLWEVLDTLLTGYEPYPALVFDAHYDLVASNQTASLLLDGVADELLEPPINIMRLALHPGGLAGRMANANQVRDHLLTRFRRHLDTWQSAELRALYDEVSRYPEPTADDEHIGPESALGPAGAGGTRAPAYF
jgi:transcriptional regulator with XRE-family HTH domain